jgi:hypothetical protein
VACCGHLTRPPPICPPQFLKALAALSDESSQDLFAMIGAQGFAPRPRAPLAAAPSRNKQAAANMLPPVMLPLPPSYGGQGSPGPMRNGGVPSSSKVCCVGMRVGDSVGMGAKGIQLRISGYVLVRYVGLWV